MTDTTARERWTRIVSEQRVSGLSIAAFGAGRGIAESSFSPWKRKLGGCAGVAGAPRDAPAFVEAKVGRDDEERAAGVAIHLACGRRVAVARGFDRRVLLEVLDTLESSAGARS